MTDRPHPLEHPDFDSRREHKIYYLAHPLAPDEFYTFEQNMAHVVKVIRICYDAGLYVVAPYHTISLALNEDNLEHCRVGLEVDCNVVRKLDGLVLTGHKLSSGMECELRTAHLAVLPIFHYIGIPDRALSTYIKTEPDFFHREKS